MRMFKKYFSCVKKSFVAIVLATMCVVPFFGNSMVKASAASYPSLVIHTSRLTKSEGSGTYAGDVKIEVSLSSSKDIFAAGIVATIGNGMSFRRDEYGDAVCGNDLRYEQSSSGSQTQCFAGYDTSSKIKSRILTIYAYSNNSLNSVNGTISIKIDSLTSASSGDVQLSNVGVHSDIPLCLNPTISYMLGDVNGDNRVDSKDSVCILSVLDNKNVSSVSVYKVANELYSWFPQAKAAEVADANLDKYINKSDANAILSYYSSSMAGVYKGNIGKNFYTVRVV